MMIPLSYSLGSLSVRRRTMATAALGIALVVLVLSGALMLTAGVRRALVQSGRSDVAVVMYKGCQAEFMSTIDRERVVDVLEGPEVKRTPDGAPLGVAEVTCIVVAQLKGDQSTSVTVRGVPDGVLQVRTSVRIIDGRAAKPGTDEAVVGQGISRRLEGAQVGGTLELLGKKNPVRIVGILADEGSSLESEVWVDVDLLASALGRKGSVSSVTVMLKSAGTFDAFKTRLASDKRLTNFEALRQSTYYERQSENLMLAIAAVTGLVAVFMSTSAMIGAMITMYSSASQRRREIGTLRALGFSRRSVLACFLFESAIVAMIGGAIGCLGSLALGNVKISMLNMATLSETVFTFQVTPLVLVVSLGAAMVLGILGGLLPALQAAMRSPLEAMRSE